MFFQLEDKHIPHKPAPSTCDVKFAYRQARKHPTSNLSVYKLDTSLVQGLSPLARDDHHANEKEHNKPNSTTAYRQHRCSASDSARGVTTVGVGGG